MNFIQFSIGLVLIVGLGLLAINVNWANQCQDLFNLFKGKEKVK
jgi:hypothetical protein